MDSEQFRYVQMVRVGSSRHANVERKEPAQIYDLNSHHSADHMPSKIVIRYQTIRHQRSCHLLHGPLHLSSIMRACLQTVPFLVIFVQFF